ncbi:ferrous iron transport protein B [Malonomonas rubra DSM 5091]|uniref:Ferrous iron transport protein B n=1 Tax=Malonomonas rubra DSM 5091 TaxID=1122189 RepID=A0A1M6DJW7_MALRU|nr:Fe(2+) transporter permease subunit FeoB [Malonomonas rubra]SHI73423.1 ferrous iron transport protein B [Malonomonas rubra DSM 5091]
MNKLKIAVAGNPNCGKTTLFNELTGARQMVGNWPGVTVDRITGLYSFEGHDFELVDIPGIYALSAHSSDERVARDYLLSDDYDLIVNVIDAANIERNLYLTTQLLEIRAPMILVLNKIDVAKARQISIDADELANRLGIPVIPISAAKRSGLQQLKKAIHQSAEEQPLPNIDISYPPAIKTAKNRISARLKDLAEERNWQPEWLALKLLEDDCEFSVLLDKSTAALVAAEQMQITELMDEDADISIADARYNFIHWLTKESVKHKTKVGKTITDKIDNVVLNRVFGIPIFLLMMYLTFMFTINVGGAFIDFFDIATGAIFVDGMSELLGGLGSPDWLIGILATGIGGGIQTVSTFIPPIAFMFFALAILEGSGYMARAAFVMDRFMRTLGLPGKAFVPMLVGFGCNVPAIMATRTLENQRDRTLTIMMNPFMSCGARLPVYALFAAAFFPVGGQNIVFLLYLAGIAFAVLTGLILKHTLLRGNITPFVMELPPYHVPTLKSVLLRTWDRLKSFLLKASRFLIPLVALLALLNTMSIDGSIGHDDSKDSLLASVSRTITPIFAPMGISQDNWPATVGIFTGIFAKEAVVGTLDAIYLQNETAAANEETANFNLPATLQEAVATIPENLAGVVGSLSDPLGLGIGDTSNRTAAAEEQDVNSSIFGTMGALFDGKVGAIAYMLFILMYFPCVAAMSAVYRETNRRWTAFLASWTTGLAYISATSFYQLATFAEHPTFSSLWLVGCLLFSAATIAIMRYLGGERKVTGIVLPAKN